MILYPFLAGRQGMETGLPDSQWIELGAVLKQIHATKLPPDLLAQIDEEAFAPQWNGRVQGREAVKRVAARVEAGGFEDVHQGAFGAFWHEHRAQITRLMDRAEELSRLLQKRPAEYVLCHTDIHTGNILLDDAGRMRIVDWDMPIMAPKERDLMFVVGGVIGGAVVQGKEELFFQGYGETDVDPLALAYYRYEWAVQDICEYAERVFVMDDVGDETKAGAVEGFKVLFQPNDEVDAAFGSEAELPPEIRSPRRG